MNKNKNKNKIKEQIAELVEEDMYTIGQICEIVGIGRKTFYRWRDTDAKFTITLTNAEQRRGEALRQQARALIKQKLDGYKQRIERTVYVPSDDDPDLLIIKQHVVTEKNVEPDTRFLLQLLANDKDVATPQKVTEAVPFSVKVRREKTENDITKLDTNCVPVIAKTEEKPNVENVMLSEQTSRQSMEKIEEEMVESKISKDTEETIQERQKRKLFEYMKKHEATFVPSPLRGVAYKLLQEK